MKNAFLILLGILRWMVIFFIAMFSLATLLTGSYLQAILLWFLAMAMAFWPRYIGEKWGRSMALGSRIIIIVSLLIGNIIAFKPEPKESIYTSLESIDNIGEGNRVNWTMPWFIQ